MALNCAAVAVGSPKSGTIPARRRRNAHVGNLRRRGNFFLKGGRQRSKKRPPPPPIYIFVTEANEACERTQPPPGRRGSRAVQQTVKWCAGCSRSPSNLYMRKGKKKKDSLLFSGSIGKISPSVGPLRLCARACSRQRHLTMRVQLNQAGALLCLLAGENGRRPNSPLP